MHIDPIVNEIHQVRAQLLDQHQGDFAMYFFALLQKQREHPDQYKRFMQTSGTQHPLSLEKVKSPINR